MYITASFHCNLTFKIPKGVKLLPDDENEDEKNFNEPGFWWIKWGVLKYYDANGEVQEIQPANENDHTDWKYPLEESVTMWPESDDEDDDSDSYTSDPAFDDECRSLISDEDDQDKKLIIAESAIKAWEEELEKAKDYSSKWERCCMRLEEWRGIRDRIKDMEYKGQLAEDEEE